MKKSMKRRFSLVLAAVMAFGSVAFAATAQAAPAQESAAAASYGLPGKIEDGAILHCWCWSYNTIKENLPQIAAAGFKTVQTSPVQRPKDYSASYTDISGQWWKLYQPLGLSLPDANTSWLGSKAELTALCAEADKYGIDVVVDIVANHLANKNAAGGGFANVNTKVDADLYKAEYFHTNTAGQSGMDRYSITQNHLGMPDLNTGNADIQNKVLALLNDCLDCGVDGFRFDAAKHIELPTDDPSFASDFWPVVLNNDAEFTYGEILPGGDSASEYAKIMKVTAAAYGTNLRTAIEKQKLSASSVKNYRLTGIDAGQLVTWVESHDNYTDDGSWSQLSGEQVNLGWALIAAQGDTTPLYFARPKGSSVTNQWGSNKMGADGDGNYYSKTVAEVNKFRNAMVGETKNVTDLVKQKVTLIERGTKGAVIVSVDSGETNLNNKTTKLADGTYTDSVGGGTFTVANGKFTGGTVAASSVAVLYPAGDDPSDVVVGDIDGDGEVTIHDATLLQGHLAEFKNPDGTLIVDETDPIAFKTADFDGNGSLTIDDVTQMQRYLAKF